MVKICGLFFGLAGCLLLPPGARAQGSCTGWIAVESTPEEGAAIIIDGKNTGRKTPATLKGISCGRHTVELKKADFVGAKKIVGVASGEVVKARVTLLPNYAPLEIRTDPTGAEIRIDERKVGKAPIRIKRMTAGAHTVTARMPDYHDTVRKFKLLPGKRFDLQIKLRPAFGSIRITARKVQEAEVFVDGDGLGPTPIELKRIVSGPHTIRVVKDGYQPYQKKVNVRDGKKTVVAATLKPNFGTLMITSKPSRANVVIDGEPRGKTPLNVKLDPGRHDVVVGAEESHGKVERRVKIRRRKKHKLNVRLSIKTGSLMIDTIPFAARIELDGKVRGRAPLSLKRVPIGTHVIVAKLRGRQPLIGKIEVLEGKPAVVEMNLNDPAKSVYKSGGTKKPTPQAAARRSEAALVGVPKTGPKLAPEHPKGTASPPEPELVPVSKPAPRTAPKPKPKPIARAEPTPRAAAERTEAVPIGVPKTEPDPITSLPLTTKKSAGMSTSDVLAWTAAGTSAALVVTGIVLFAVGGSRDSEADDYYKKYKAETNPVLSNFYKDRFTDLDNQVAGLRTGGWICVGVGAAAAGASVLLFLTGSRTAVHFNPVPGGAWVGIEGQF
jgi:hypothetical protein